MRFIKRWCAKCSSMQFAGECGHGLDVTPTVSVQEDAGYVDGIAPFHRAEQLEWRARELAKGNTFPARRRL